MTKPELIILIGLPGSGKSTWRSKFLAGSPNYIVASSDDIIDQLCDDAGMTYSEGFDKFVGQATSKFNNIVKAAFNAGDNLIIDRTNMSAKNRKKFIQMGKDNGYLIRAVDFQISDYELKARLKARGEATGKWIPDYVLKNMANNYDRPSKEEGFDRLEFVS